MAKQFINCESVAINFANLFAVELAHRGKEVQNQTPPSFQIKPLLGKKYFRNILYGFSQTHYITYNPTIMLMLQPLHLLT